PEQAMTTRADIYSLGAILRDPSQGARPALTSIVNKALSENPDHRYATALELRDEVARYLDGERVQAHTESFPERAARLYYRHQTAILLIAAYLVMRMLLLILLGR